MAPLTLLTGFPGFIGRRLVRSLLEQDPEARVVALVEERMLAPAQQAAAAIDPERIELLTGDIAVRGLGLAPEDWQRLTAEVTHVHHLAAIYNLAVPLELAQRVNVDGTGNVLELCLAAERLERLMYVSTAYVAGYRRGIVYEHELSLGQQFKNHYESTKFQAELWVQQLIERVPTTIIRPAIVVGDSQTGETEKFDGPYFLLRTIAQAHRNHRAVPQFGRSDATFNVVPVDYVVAAMVALADDPAAAGQTLHLVDPEPLPTRELVSTLSRAYAGREPKGKLPPALAAGSLRLSPVRKMLGGAPWQSIVYLNHAVSFDTRRALDLLEPHGLRPPAFGSYAEAMVRYFRTHEDDPSYAPAL
ncbi:MAG TPA: SDR family oxidoreductase [Thermoleophilaceae bacterium]